MVWLESNIGSQLRCVLHVVPGHDIAVQVGVWVLLVDQCPKSVVVLR